MIIGLLCNKLPIFPQINEFPERYELSNLHLFSHLLLIQLYDPSILVGHLLRLRHPADYLLRVRLPGQNDSAAFRDLLCSKKNSSVSSYGTPRIYQNVAPYCSAALPSPLFWELPDFLHFPTPTAHGYHRNNLGPTIGPHPSGHS